MCTVHSVHNVICKKKRRTDHSYVRWLLDGSFGGFDVCSKSTINSYVYMCQRNDVFYHIHFLLFARTSWVVRQAQAFIFIIIIIIIVAAPLAIAPVPFRFVFFFSLFGFLLFLLPFNFIFNFFRRRL